MKEEVENRMRRTVSDRVKKVQGSQAIDSHQPHRVRAAACREDRARKKEKKGHCRFATRMDRCVSTFSLL